MSEHYEKVIDFLTTKHDWKSMCIEIGKKYPEILCEFISTEDSLKIEVLNLIKNEQCLGLSRFHLPGSLFHCHRTFYSSHEQVRL